MRAATKRASEEERRTDRQTERKKKTQETQRLV